MESLREEMDETVSQVILEKNDLITNIRNVYKAQANWKEFINDQAEWNRQNNEQVCFGKLWSTQSVNKIFLLQNLKRPQQSVNQSGQ